MVSFVETYLADEAKTMNYIVRVEPNRKNERLAIQKGTFLFPFDITKTF